MRSTMGSLLSAPIWSRVAARPVGELRERAAELAFQASDVGALADRLEPRTQHPMRRGAHAEHGFLDAPLVVEVRDARLHVRRSHGCVDLMFDAGLARQRRETLALRRFPLDTRLPCVLHAEDAPRPGQRT